MILKQLVIFLICITFASCKKSKSHKKIHVNAYSDRILHSDAFENKRLSAMKPLKILPGSKAPPFEFLTLNKGLVKYPSSQLPLNVSIGFHAFSKNSGFIEGMWHSIPKLANFVHNSPKLVNYIFLSFDEPVKSVAFMYSQINKALDFLKYKKKQKSAFMKKCFFVLTPVFKMDNWIFTLLNDWACEGHGCGYDQVVFRSKSWKNSFKVLQRLDARYDWIWNHKWKEEFPEVLYEDDACNFDLKMLYNQSVVMVSDDQGKCSVVEKVQNLQRLNAIGVLVYSAKSEPVKDYNCHDFECLIPVSIPVASIPYDSELVATVKAKGKVNAELQTKPSPTFFFTIDSFGRLNEFGWALYPSLEFLAWQMQWLEYKQKLFEKINQLNDYTVSIFDHTTMKGKNGTGVRFVNLSNVQSYDKMYLEAELGCQGTKDEDCPPWDHVVSLYACCGTLSCINSEIGRWITPFRRRTGHWLTDVSPLLPKFLPAKSSSTSKCKFVMKNDAWWAKPWVPSLKLRFKKSKSSSKPYYIEPLFSGGTFDKNFNSKYKPHSFLPPASAKSVKIFAVISGHGSDNNQCGEFCITSHHFIINNEWEHVMKFDDAGSPLGCTKQVIKGAVPNEHGTWLYGRGGWCDGMPVKPWEIDITKHVLLGHNNTVTYRGLFQGKNPDPTSNPGLIRLTSFLVYYN